MRSDDAKDEEGECRECLDCGSEIEDGLCSQCQWSDYCPTCEGTGYGEGWSDEDGAEECEDCGGDGVI